MPTVCATLDISQERKCNLGLRTEGWDGEGGGRQVQDGEHMNTRG